MAKNMALPYPFDKLQEFGLFVAPLGNGDWVCGKANVIYSLDILSDHYQDPRLVVEADPRKAIERALWKIKIWDWELKSR